MLRSRVTRFLGVLFAGVLLAGLGAAQASAVSPWWRLSSSSRPAVLAPGGEGTIAVRAVNVGDSATSGAVTFSDTLPAGVTVQSAHLYDWPRFGVNVDLSFFCETQPGSVRCTLPEFFPALSPYEAIEMQIVVQVANGAGGENRVQVTGDEASTASFARPLAIQGGATPFGVDDLELAPEEEGGAVDARAGSHPFQLSSVFALNQNADPSRPPALVRDVRLKLPAGLVGNATVIPQCSEQNFGFVAGSGVNLCPADTAVGVAVVTIDEPVATGFLTRTVPLFNLVPSHGEPARFGFEVLNSPVTLDTSVRSGSDYGVTVTASNITQLASLVDTVVTFWGVPGDSRHDKSRGWGCVANEYWGELGIGVEPCTPLHQSDPVPLLTLPTSCTLPFTASLEGDAWPTKANPEGLSLLPGAFSLRDALGREIGLTGCDQLPFTPSIHIAPDTNAASTPTGLTASVHIPQDASSSRRPR